MAGIITCRAHRGSFFFHAAVKQHFSSVLCFSSLRAVKSRWHIRRWQSCVQKDGQMNVCTFLFLHFVTLPKFRPSLHSSYYCECICVIKLLCICVIKTIYICADACSRVCVCSCTTQRSNQSPLAGQERVQRGNEGVISLAGRLLRY